MSFVLASLIVLCHKEQFCKVVSVMSKRKRPLASDDGNRGSKRKATADNHDSLGQWAEVGSANSKGLKPLIYSTNEIDGSAKIAGFDLDGTIITTASGKTFPTGPKDWKFWDDSVPGKLRAVSQDGYKVVIFTNQAGIEKNKTTAKDMMIKITDIIGKIGLDIQVFMSTGENQFRKPSTQMWDFMLEKCNKGVSIDKQKSYYVGDAAGRAKGWASGKRKDFNCTDRKFAANIGIDFFTPEEYFLGQKKAAFEWGSVPPKELAKNDSHADYSKLVSTKSDRELVLMVGPPASGKSTLSAKYFKPKGYVIVNRDLMKTQDKCIKNAIEALKSGKKVIVDNTNPSKEARAVYTNISKKMKCPVRCLWLQTSFDLAHHLNLFRQTQSEGKQRRVPDVGFNVFKSKFEEPSLDEGFSEIEKIFFKPEFDCNEDERLFEQWS